METRTVTTILPIDMAEKLDQLAKNEDRSKAWLIKDAIQSMLDVKERQHQMMLEGLADIDAGRIVSEEKIRDWIKSLPKKDKSAA